MLKRIVLVGALVIQLAGCALAAPVSEDRLAAPANDAARKPNVIVILADDLGFGDLSSYGATLIRTPNIDRLADEGVRMTSFYAGANVCSPSRASLLTGRYPIRSGMQFVIRPHSTGGLPPGEITLAELLRDAGYATGMVGKWHLGHQAEFWPTRHGFDSFYGVAYSNDMMPFDLYDGTQVIESPVDQTTLTPRYADAAVRFIEENADQPFFLYYADNSPHIPLFHPPQNAGRSEAGEYGDVVETLDDAVGDVLDALDRLNIADDTLVIFTSDNGPWFEGSAGDLRGRKGGTAQGSYQVPMLARWPGVIPTGTETGEMAMSIDILPTVAAIAGIAVPGDREIDGRNILPVLSEGAPTPHDALYFFDGNDVVAVRDKRYRLLLKVFYRNSTINFLDTSGYKWWAPLLFDLQKDPSESYSIAAREPEVLRALMKRAAAMSEATATLHKVADPLRAAPKIPKGPQLEP